MYKVILILNLPPDEIRLHPNAFLNTGISIAKRSVIFQPTINDNFKSQEVGPLFPIPSYEIPSDSIGIPEWIARMDTNFTSKKSVSIRQLAEEFDTIPPNKSSRYVMANPSLNPTIFFSFV